jgi:hypothetical protein
MRCLLLALAVSIPFAGTMALAQPAQPDQSAVVTGPSGLPSIEPYSTSATHTPGSSPRSEVAPALPSVDVGVNPTANDYLKAALAALSARQTGKAQAAIENAETLLHTRSVPLGAGGTPDQSPAVRNLSQALQKLGSHDVKGASDLVRHTLASTQQ